MNGTARAAARSASAESRSPLRRARRAGRGARAGGEEDGAVLVPAQRVARGARRRSAPTATSVAPAMRAARSQRRSILPMARSSTVRGGFLPRWERPGAGAGPAPGREPRRGGRRVHRPLLLRHRCRRQPQLERLLVLDDDPEDVQAERDDQDERSTGSGSTACWLRRRGRRWPRRRSGASGRTRRGRSRSRPTSTTTLIGRGQFGRSRRRSTNPEVANTWHST